MNITAVTVVYNTPSLIKIAVKSIRKYYPTMPIVIIDGSPVGSECFLTTLAMMDKHTHVEHTHQNVGHGPGMCRAINMSKTPYILLFDSDIEMKGRCLEQMMLKLTESQNVYGVGKVVKVDRYGINCSSGIPYLHPHFALISKRNYNKFFPFVHSGAPCIKAMIKLSQQRQIFVYDFPVENYVLHKERGTRNVISKEGRKRVQRPVKKLS